MLTRPAAIFLVLVASFIWGSYPGILKNSVEGFKVLPFMFSQHVVQIIVALLIVLSQIGDFQRDFLARKFFCLFVAGVFSSLSDFLYVSSSRHLSMILTRLYANLFADVYVGIIIERFVPNDMVDMQYLICAAVLYCAGLIAFTSSEHEYSKQLIGHDEKIITIKKKKKNGGGGGKKGKKHHRLPMSKAGLDDIALHAVESGSHPDHVIDPEEEGEAHEEANGVAEEDEEEEESSKSSEIDFGMTFKDFDSLNDDFGAPNPFFKDHHVTSNIHPSKEIRPKQESILMINIDEMFSKSFSMTVALMSGICLAMFFILSTVGMSGDGKITSWTTAFLFCQLGKITSLPILLYFFGYWDPLDMFPTDERLSSMKELFDFNTKKLMVSSVIGVALSGSYALIYFTSTVVPFAIIDGLMTFETMIYYLMAFFCWRGYGKLEFPLSEVTVKPYHMKLVAGYVFYTAAMLTIALRAYLH
jgi:hypothetical protein